MTDMATYLKSAQSEPKSQPAIAFGRWSCACQDADGVLFPLLHSSSSWSSTNNPEINKALEAARGTLDEKTRLENYKTVSTFVARKSHSCRFIRLRLFMARQSSFSGNQPQMKASS